jgi:hypothetical protein
VCHSPPFVTFFMFVAVRKVALEVPRDLVGTTRAYKERDKRSALNRRVRSQYAPPPNLRDRGVVKPRV